MANTPARAENVVTKLSQMIDEIVVEYLRVNEETCEGK